MFELTPFVRRNRMTFDPFREMEALERAFFGTPQPSSYGFKTDILEKKDAFVLEAELPGFSKEDIAIDVDGDYLTVSATHKTETDDSTDAYVRRERRFGTYSRTFDVSSVKTEAITAAYKDGVLTLTMPKKDETVVTTRKIDIQ